MRINSEASGKKNALVLGGGGFVGRGIVKELTDDGWRVRVINRHEAPGLPRSVEFIVSAAENAGVLEKAMEGVDVVFDLISYTIPSMNDKTLINEINALGRLDNLLSLMHRKNVNNLVFPSSGGAIYGEIGTDERVNEQYLPRPVTAYGMGKLLCEDTINYYCRCYDLNCAVLRIGNLYGYPLFRQVAQGVVDIFIQNILMGKPLQLWGNAENVIRDYIYIDDVGRAAAAVADHGFKGVEVYNVASGVGNSLKDIIGIISEELDVVPEIVVNASKNAGISRIVLDISRIYNQIGWKPQWSLEEGIRRTIKIKRDNLEW